MKPCVSKGFPACSKIVIFKKDDKQLRDEHQMKDKSHLLEETSIQQLFLDLARLDAPSLQERPVADAVTQFLASLGLAVEEDAAGQAIGGNCGNLLCRIPANWALRSQDPAGQSLESIARASDCAARTPFLDTVQPCHDKKIALGDDRVFRSDGTTILGADDLSGVVAVLAAIHSLDQQPQPHRGIELLFSVAEEVHLQGIARFDPTQLTAKEGYVFDTSGAPGLGVIAAPGHLHLTFIVTGRSAHAGIAPETGVSAITAAARGIAAMRLGRINQRTTANIGRISGGGETNIVAEQCIVTAECRSLDPVELAAQADLMCACMTNAAHELGAELATEIHQSYHPYQVAGHEPVVRRFQAACAAISKTARLIETGGGSDMNVLAQAGIRGMVLSCGMQQVHTCAEHLALDDLIDLTHLVLALIQSEI
jgi:tripeptide aminopeptidase